MSSSNPTPDASDKMRYAAPEYRAAQRIVDHCQRVLFAGIDYAAVVQDIVEIMNQEMPSSVTYPELPESDEPPDKASDDKCNPNHRRPRPMTDTETTTLKEIQKRLETLQELRRDMSRLDAFIKWSQVRTEQGLPPVVPRGLEVYHEGKRFTLAFDADVLMPAAVLSRHQWHCDVVQLEKWLDARNIEHVESAKAD